MSSIVPPEIDLEHWNAKMENGGYPMFAAMQKTATTAWTNREDSVHQLILWWRSMPSYDPDIEPETLVYRNDLSDLSKEVLGVAAAHRIRPRALGFDLPDAQGTAQWLSSRGAKSLRHVLSMNDSGAWWNRCLFEDSEERYHARTEHLISALMADHSFVHMANSLNTPLHELLPMLESQPSFFVPGHTIPEAQDLW